LFGKEDKEAEWWQRIAKPIIKQEMGDDYDYSVAHDIKQQWDRDGADMNAKSIVQTIKDAVEYYKLAHEIDHYMKDDLEKMRDNGITLEKLRKLVAKIGKRRDDERMKRRDRAMSGQPRGPGETAATRAYELMVNRKRAADKGWDRDTALDNGLSVDGNFGREWRGEAPDPDDLEDARKKARESTRGVGR